MIFVRTSKSSFFFLDCKILLYYSFEIKNKPMYVNISYNINFDTLEISWIKLSILVEGVDHWSLLYIELFKGVLVLHICRLEVLYL